MSLISLYKYDKNNFSLFFVQSPLFVGRGGAIDVDKRMLHIPVKKNSNPLFWLTKSIYLHNGEEM